MDQFLIIMTTLFLCVIIYHQIKDFILGKFYYSKLDGFSGNNRNSLKIFLILITFIITAVVAIFAYEFVGKAFDYLGL